MQRPTILLASNSPRRRKLLHLGGWDFRTDAADIDETPLPGEAPSAYVLRLSAEKAKTVLARALPTDLVIGSDTTVVVDGEILGKPADAAEARSMLQRLRARTHQVYTGIAVIRASDQLMLRDVCITDVPMRDYSDDEIERYIATGDPMDKAGAYGIQNLQFQPVINMAGCYASVMGLPLCHLAVLLREFAQPPSASLPQNCQVELLYSCPVFHSVLGETP